jgi:hypothetical protein
MNMFYAVLASILAIAVGAMSLQWWLDHGAHRMPARLRLWFLGK